MVLVVCGCVCVFMCMRLNERLVTVPLCLLSEELMILKTLNRTPAVMAVGGWGVGEECVWGGGCSGDPQPSVILLLYNFTK